MNTVSQSVRVGVLTLIAAVGGWWVWQSLSVDASGDDGYSLWLLLDDASGLPKDARVLMNGIVIGQISDAEFYEGKAKMTVRIRRDQKIWSNATAFKKNRSVLGGNYLEIDRGLEDGKSRLLEDGDQIVNVQEPVALEDVIRKANEALDGVPGLVTNIDGLVTEVRGLATGPIRSAAEDIARLTSSESRTVERILGRVEQISRDIRGMTKPNGGKINGVLDQLDAATRDARTLIKSTQGEIESTGDKLREKLDALDGILASTDSVAAKIDSDQGTIGRLVNDSKIADNIEEITDDAKGFVRTLFGMQAYVDLRTEYLMRSGGLRGYVAVTLSPRPDKFYYIDISRGPRGNYPEIALDYNLGSGEFDRRVSIEDKFRFSFQFGKRIGWATFRYGIKESTGGIGMDGQWFNDRAKLSVDFFDADWNELPRVKIAAAVQMWRYFYVLGGVDDLLNGHETLAVNAGPSDVPIKFDSLHYGRDYFLGAQLRFNDRDLAALLFMGGAALSGLVN